MYLIEKTFQLIQSIVCSNNNIYLIITKLIKNIKKYYFLENMKN